jgi:A/G-specific adenine glycosylase
MTLSAPAFEKKRLRPRRTRADPPPREPTAALGRRLLAWYDRNRRDLPWRAKPGERSDPYRVWVSEIMLQQTTVAAVIPYFHRFIARFPTVARLAAADLDDVLKQWAGLGYYARARNLHACARMVVERHGGVIPRDLAELRALPGVGDYTAAAIAAIAFDQRVAAVDGNVERVAARLFAVGEPMPRAKAVIRRAAERLTPARRAGDFAQALMDLGSTVCTPRNPDCRRCPWRTDCAARRRGDPHAFPARTAKRQGRLRRGAAFVALRADGAVLLRTRPADGLLGGMTEVPTTGWAHEFDESAVLAQAPVHCPSPSARLRRARPSPRKRGEGGERQRHEPSEGRVFFWRRVPGVVTHVFTHFPLELFVYVAHVPQTITAPAGMRWVARADLEGEALPNLMRKVIAQAGANVVRPVRWQS